VEEKANGEKARMGMVVCLILLPLSNHTTTCCLLACAERSRKKERKRDANYDIAMQVIRGNSVVLLEALERIGGDDRRGGGGGDHRG
jgi:hypothetical protein